MEIVKDNKDNVIPLVDMYQIDGFHDMYRGFILPHDHIKLAEAKEFQYTDEKTGEFKHYEVVKLFLKPDEDGLCRIYIKTTDAEEADQLERELNKIRMSRL